MTEGCGCSWGHSTRKGREMLGDQAGGGEGARRGSSGQGKTWVLLAVCLRWKRGRASTHLPFGSGPPVTPGCARPLLQGTSNAAVCLSEAIDHGLQRAPMVFLRVLPPAQPGCSTRVRAWGFQPCAACLPQPEPAGPQVVPCLAWVGPVSVLSHSRSSCWE